MEAEFDTGRGPDEEEPAQRPWYRRMSLALSAFIMSLTITLINAFYGLQGAEIVVQAPKQVLLYRDGEGANSVLGVTLRTDVINAAGGYGDVLVEAELVPSAGGPRFEYQGVVNPVFTDLAAEAAKECELGARCIGLPGLLVVERSDQVIDLPGGGAKALNLTFPVAAWNCVGAGSLCQAYGTFDKAVSALASKSLDLRLHLHFHSDGKREIMCRGGRMDAEYLRKIGWISLSCEEAKVSGAPLL